MCGFLPIRVSFDCLSYCLAAFAKFRISFLVGTIFNSPAIINAGSAGLAHFAIEILWLGWRAWQSSVRKQFTNLATFPFPEKSRIPLIGLDSRVAYYTLPYNL